jgi:hypothetical protein
MIREGDMAEELKQADQIGTLPNSIVIRTTGEPTSIAAAVRQAIWSLDKE